MPPGHGEEQRMDKNVLFPGEDISVRRLLQAEKLRWVLPRMWRQQLLQQLSAEHLVLRAKRLLPLYRQHSDLAGGVQLSGSRDTYRCSGRVRRHRLSELVEWLR